MVSRNAEGNLDSCRRFAIGRKSRSRSSRKEQEPRWEGIHPARAFLRMIGQSNRQTLPQRAGVCFQSFMLPQCANVPYCAEKLNRLGYKSAEGTQRPVCWTDPQPRTFGSDSLLSTDYPRCSRIPSMTATKHKELLANKFSMKAANLRSCQ
jgi:hypothetical protein